MENNFVTPETLARMAGLNRTALYRLRPFARERGQIFFDEKGKIIGYDGRAAVWLFQYSKAEKT